MDFFDGHFIWQLFQKRLSSLCTKILDHTMNKISIWIMKMITRKKGLNMISLSMLFKLCISFFSSIYCITGLSILLLVIFTGNRLLNSFNNKPSAKADSCISIILPNEHVIHIPIRPDSNVTYIDLGTDSIAYALKSAGNSNCGGWTKISIPEGFPPIQTRLPDGTILYLNTGSCLFFKICPASDKREVKLQGEAYFDIAADAQRTFTVQTKGLSVTVVGTRFNIKDYQDSDKAEVSVLGGRIILTANGKGKSVQAGESVIFNRNNGTTDFTLFDERLVTAWHSGKYFFKNERLPEICKVASRLYGQPIIINSNVLNTKRFTGMLDRKRPLREFLSHIKDTGEVDSYVDNKGLVHLR